MLGIERQNQCFLQINGRRQPKIPLDSDGFTLILEYASSEIIQKVVENAFEGVKDPKKLKFHSQNLNVTLAETRDRIYGLCAADFFPAGWSCHEKAQLCKRNIQFALKESRNFRERIIGMELSKNCQNAGSIQVEIYAEDKRFYCKDPLQSDHVNRKNACKLALGCKAMAYDIIERYESNLEKCQQKAGSFEYGLSIQSLGRIEFLKTNSSKEIPEHAKRMCLTRYSELRLEFAPLEDGWFTLTCSRSAASIISMISQVPDCFDFVAKCQDMMTCTSRQLPCYDKSFGLETPMGFKVPLNESTKLTGNCHHWAAQVYVEDHKVFCKAKGRFKFNGKDFCESYVEACQKLVKCKLDSIICVIPYYKLSTTENHKNLLFDVHNVIKYVTAIPHMQVLYRCNKMYGHNKVTLYFYKVDCSRNNCRSMRTMSGEDLLQQARLFADQRTNSYTDRNSILEIIWFCKRSVISDLSCQRFHSICIALASCIWWAVHHPYESSPEFLSAQDTFVMDKRCHSPLSFHPAIPLPELALSDKSFQNGALYGGNAMTHILLMKDKSFSPSFSPIGQARRQGQQVPEQLLGPGLEPEPEPKPKPEPGSRAEQGQLASVTFPKSFFFTLFIEDCKRANKFFQGDLIEAMGVDEVHFIICSLPLGGNKDRVNPVVEKGCLNVKQTCEDMKNCYVNFREYFTLSNQFEKHLENIATIAISLMIICLCINAMECFSLISLKRFKQEKYLEVVLYILLLIGGVILYLFHHNVKDWQQDSDHGDPINLMKEISILRWIWELLLYFVVVFFHFHVISFAMYSYFMMSEVTNLCKNEFKICGTSEIMIGP